LAREGLRRDAQGRVVRPPRADPIDHPVVAEQVDARAADAAARRAQQPLDAPDGEEPRQGVLRGSAHRHDGTMAPRARRRARAAQATVSSGSADLASIRRAATARSAPIETRPRTPPPEVDARWSWRRSFAQRRL